MESTTALVTSQGGVFQTADAASVLDGIRSGGIRLTSGSVVLARNANSLTLKGAVHNSGTIEAMGTIPKSKSQVQRVIRVAVALSKGRGGQVNPGITYSK